MGKAMTPEERRERGRLASERYRRKRGIMPRKPAQKPWLAEGVSRSTWYRRGNRISARLADLKIGNFPNLPGAKNDNLSNLKSNTVLDLSRAESFIAQLQAELAEAARCHAIAAAVIAEMAAGGCCAPGAAPILSASGLKRQDNDLVVIESAEAATGFRRAFDTRFARRSPLARCPRSPLTQKPGDNSRDQGAANRAR
jgi:hypothetical protein